MLKSIDEFISYTRHANILDGHGIKTNYDLAELYPRKYHDYRTLSDVKTCKDGDRAAIKGVLTSLKKTPFHSNPDREYLLGYLDQDGTDVTIFIFDRVYLFDSIEALLNREIVIAGKIQYSQSYGYNISDIDGFWMASAFTPHIENVYKKFSGMSNDKLTEYIDKALMYTKEPLEAEVVQRFKIPDYRKSIFRLHYPKTDQDMVLGKRRILFDDLLYFSMMLQSSGCGNKESSVVFSMKEKVAGFIKDLPFSLTLDQESAINTMLTHASNGERNDILLQGDVGCGKTIVAAIMMFCAAESGYQAVMMAPRTVLAEQHYNEISEYAKILGINCVFLHSKMRVAEKKKIYKQIEEGTAKIIIGTHSCISKDVNYQNLGLVVTDEEHLFGVAQKEAIKEKANEGLHIICMSATPIPRTMATVLYGDSKEILYIKTKPAGRLPIKTFVVGSRNGVFRNMEEAIELGRQIYVVCPAIDQNGDEDLASVEEVTKAYKERFGENVVCTMHGHLDKFILSENMKNFLNGRYKIMVATTVIEVGVNNPNATVMVVEQADRFGLASLHQLRGRVGRSDKQSFCFLISKEIGNERLEVMKKTTDGFEIAEADLVQRGSGNLIGTEQAGLNKYVTEMLENPKMYECAVHAAKFCRENGYGQKLIDIYKMRES